MKTDNDWLHWKTDVCSGIYEGLIGVLASLIGVFITDFLLLVFCIGTDYTTFGMVKAISSAIIVIKDRWDCNNRSSDFIQWYFVVTFIFMILDYYIQQ